MSPPASIFFCNRHGGISQAPFHSLNLSYGVGDQRDAVQANRNLLKLQHGIEYLLSARQIHSDRIFIAREPLHQDLEIDGYDALMTNTIGTGLLIQQADCQAVTLFDPDLSVIAAIHCGWKGSVLNILARTVRAMAHEYGSLATTLQATISPSLGPCCAEFIHHHRELPPAFLAFQDKANYFDFWQISRIQLQEAGLEDSNIHCADLCTVCSPDYFSYRRACQHGDGRTGRCGTVIVLSRPSQNRPHGE